MKIKLKNRIIEINTIGKPDDNLWQQGYSVRLGRRFFINTKFTFYIMIWNK